MNRWAQLKLFSVWRALPGSVNTSFHIIELACIIQVFKLICFGLKQSGHMCRKKRNLFPQGDPVLFFFLFVSEESLTSAIWFFFIYNIYGHMIMINYFHIEVTGLYVFLFFFVFLVFLVRRWKMHYMDSPPPVRWSTGRKELMEEGLLILPPSPPLGLPHRLVE